MSKFLYWFFYISVYCYKYCVKVKYKCSRRSPRSGVPDDNMKGVFIVMDKKEENKDLMSSNVKKVYEKPVVIKYADLIDITGAYQRMPCKTSSCPGFS